MVEIPRDLLQSVQLHKFRHLEEIPKTEYNHVIGALQTVVDQHLVLSSGEMLAAAKNLEFERIKESYEDAADAFALLLDADYKNRKNGGPESNKPKVLELRKSFHDMIYGSPEEQISMGLEFLKAVKVTGEVK